MKEYQKIETVFERDTKTKKLFGNVEGFVVRPTETIYDNNLERVIVKLKFRDFKEK